DDERVVTRALEREDAEQIVGGILDVRAFLPSLSFGNPEEPEETHHMVDAQRAGVAKSTANEPNEIAVAIGAQCARIDRRKSPVLSRRRVRIGRRADAGALDEELRLGPGVGGPARGTQR